MIRHLIAGIAIGAILTSAGLYYLRGQPAHRGDTEVLPSVTLPPGKTGASAGATSIHRRAPEKPNVIAFDNQVHIDLTQGPQLQGGVDVISHLSVDCSAGAITSQPEIKRDYTLYSPRVYRGEVGVRYGLAATAGMEWTLYGRYDLFRFGSLALAGYGEARYNPIIGAIDGLAQVDLRYQF